MGVVSSDRDKGFENLAVDRERTFKTVARINPALVPIKQKSSFRVSLAEELSGLP